MLLFKRYPKYLKEVENAQDRKTGNDFIDALPSSIRTYMVGIVEQPPVSIYLMMRATHLYHVSTYYIVPRDENKEKGKENRT